MMHTQSNDARYRDAIERELRERLARQQPAQGAPATPVSTAAAPNALVTVALICLECRGMNEADARFCTSCGKAFNALVVPAPRRRQGS